MKKQTTKSLTAYQKRYLKHQVLQYFLLLAVVQAAKGQRRTFTSEALASVQIAVPTSCQGRYRLICISDGSSRRPTCLP